MRRQRKSPMSGVRKRAKDAWTLFVKERAGWRCEKCGTTKALAAHHVIPSTWERYRFDPRNGVCLCYRHHIHWAHKDSFGFTDWICDDRPQDADYFRQPRKTLDRNRTLADYRQIVADLEAMLALERAA